MQARARPRDQLHRLATGLAAGLLLVSAQLAPSAHAGIPDLSTSLELSNERTFTRWAHPIQIQPIREWPKADSRVVAPVSLTTEDGLPEVYPLLRGWTDGTGREWLRIRVPMRPHGRTGWVDTSALGPAQLVRTQLVVDRRKLRATLKYAGRVVWNSRIGIGAPGTPTPPGRFWIRERIRSADPSGPYGPLAFGTSAYSRLSDWPGGGVIGIHGTNQPQLIPGRPSHGCIRLPNRAIRRLARLMPVGTPVWIR